MQAPGTSNETEHRTARVGVEGMTIEAGVRTRRLLDELRKVKLEAEQSRGVVGAEQLATGLRAMAAAIRSAEQLLERLDRPAGVSESESHEASGQPRGSAGECA